MMQQRSGIIINISSMPGLAGIPSQSVYSATEFVVQGRVKPHHTYWSLLESK
jgi:short-subunit dehydrogenase